MSICTASFPLLPSLSLYNCLALLPLYLCSFIIFLTIFFSALFVDRGSSPQPRIGVWSMYFTREPEAFMLRTGYFVSFGLILKLIVPSIHVLLQSMFSCALLFGLIHEDEPLNELVMSFERWITTIVLPAGQQNKTEHVQKGERSRGSTN